MAPFSRWLCSSVVLVLMAAACSATPGPQPSPPAGTPFLLRATIVQALPPSATLGWLPGALITVDRRVLVGGAVPAIYPGPLLQPIIQRSLSAEGWATIVAAARELGLLAGTGDFSAGGIAPGGQTGRLELFVDGRMVTISGDPSRVLRCGAQRCPVNAGTPEAFAAFWEQVADLQSWPGLGLGPESPYVPDGYVVVVGPPPAEDQLSAPPVAWPGSTPLVAFGAPLTDGAGRCGTVTGTNAVVVGAAFQSATAITRWHDPGSAELHGLTVRPLLPGDGDPCVGLVAG
jgi:hypothetical protein